MIVCGVKTGDQVLLVMVWILTGTIMIIGMRLETMMYLFIPIGNMISVKGW